MIRKLFAIASRGIYKPTPPVRDEDYKLWIRSWPSIVSKRRYFIEAAHTGTHGMSQKASDLTCIPLTHEEHQELHRIGPVNFQELHQIDIPEIVAMFNALWEERKKAA